MPTSLKLAVAVCVLLGVSTYMAYLGAESSWKYYVTADECQRDARHLLGTRIRVSGRICPGSLTYSAQGDVARFSLDATAGPLPVTCAGPFPDNLSDAGEVVVEGIYEASGMVRGEKVLTRCASKYEQREPAVTQSEPAIAEPQGPP
jgi:cytochrome c-type biogenesis protein CcmE